MKKNTTSLIFVVSCLGFFSLIFAAGCSSTPERTASSYGDHPAFHKLREPLVPVAHIFNFNSIPRINEVVPGSTAQKAGLQAGDIVVQLNGSPVITIADFENILRTAPHRTSIVVKRDRQQLLMALTLEREKPRLAIHFEPDSIALVKKTSPLVAYMRKDLLTTFAESSLNQKENELHLNLILESQEILPSSRLTIYLREKGHKKPFAQSSEVLGVLGGAPKLISKVFYKPDGVKGPVELFLNVDKKRFRFEFQ